MKEAAIVGGIAGSPKLAALAHLQQGTPGPNKRSGIVEWIAGSPNIMR